VRSARVGSATSARSCAAVGGLGGCSVQRSPLHLAALCSVGTLPRMRSVVVTAPSHTCCSTGARHLHPPVLHQPVCACARWPVVPRQGGRRKHAPLVRQRHHPRLAGGGAAAAPREEDEARGRRGRRRAAVLLPRRTLLRGVGQHGHHPRVLLAARRRRRWRLHRRAAVCDPTTKHGGLPCRQTRTGRVMCRMRLSLSCPHRAGGL
jgi:hypothetical protein